MGGGSKNGSLDIKNLTRQTLGSGGEKVRGKEDGDVEFLSIVKLFPARSLTSSRPDLIS